MFHLADSFRFFVLIIGILIASSLSAQASNSEKPTGGSGSAVGKEGDSPEEIEGPEKKAPRSRKRRSSKVALEELSPTERIRIQRQMGDVDLYGKDGVAYRKSWGFRSGVTQLYPPFYEGWANGYDAKGHDVKGLFEKLAEDGEPGYTLSSVSFNERYYRQTGREFINFYALVWVPEQYAFTLFQENSFQPIKDNLRETIVKARKGYAKRGQFETFQDYVAFKFGRDEEIENFVDGFWVEANESAEHLTYFYTPEFLVERKRQAFVRPLIATATFLIVRNKLLRLDIIRSYDSPEDIPSLLEFTKGLREDMKIVNRYGESDK